MNRDFAMPALFFGSMAVVMTALILAVAALIASLAIGFKAVPGAPAVLNTMTLLVPVAMPIFVFGFSCLFAMPSGLVAAFAFFVGASLVVRLRLNRLALVLVGGLAGLVGAAVVFPLRADWVLLIGALSGVLSSMVWLRVRVFSSAVTTALEVSRAGVR